MGLMLLASAGWLVVVMGALLLGWRLGARDTREQRRRADRAEERLARLRAQQRQRRQPLVVPPGLFPAGDRALAQEARPVLARAETDQTQRLTSQLGGGWSW
jgi:hypothetical protein